MKNLIIKRTLIALFATLVFSGGFALTQSFYERQVISRPGVVATTDPVTAVTQPLATAANNFPTLQPLTIPTSVPPVQQPQSVTPQLPAPTTGPATTSVPSPIAQPAVVTKYYPARSYDVEIAELREQIRRLATQTGIGQLQYDRSTRVLSLGSSSVRLPEYRYTSSSNSGSSSSGGSVTVDLTPVTNRLDTIEATLAGMPAAIPASTSATYYRGDQTWATLDTAAVPENGNLYFTPARFTAELATKTSDDVTEGFTNLYYTSTRANTDFDTRLATKTTDNLAEGTTSQYFTATRAQNAITGAASSIVTSNLTSSRALASDASGKVAASAVTSTELGYLSGVTSAIQTQINNRMLAPAGTTTQYIRGDGTLATLNTSIVPESGNLYFTNARARSAISVSSPLSYNSGTGLISIAQATAGQNGYLSSADWSTFNNKVTSATNGLYFDGINVGLGGALNNDTIVDTQNNSVGFGSGLSIRSKFTSFLFGDNNYVDTVLGSNYLVGESNTAIDSKGIILGVSNSATANTNVNIFGSSIVSDSSDDSLLTGGGYSASLISRSSLFGNKVDFKNVSKSVFSSFDTTNTSDSTFLFGFAHSNSTIASAVNSMIWGSSLDIDTVNDSVVLGASNIVRSANSGIVLGGSNDFRNSLNSGVFGYGNNHYAKDSAYMIGNSNRMGKDVLLSAIVGYNNNIDDGIKSSFVIGQGNTAINNAAYMIGEGMTSDTNSTIYLGFDDATKTTIDSAGTMNVRGQQFITTTNGSGSDVVVFDNGSGAICTVAPGGTEFACSSDERLKTNIETIPNALESVNGLRGVTYNWKNTPENTVRQYGFIAQEVERVVPELVGTDYRGMKIMGYQNIVPLLVNAVNEIAQITGDFRDSLISWMGNASNGIQQFFADTVTARRVETTELCVGQPGDQICVTKDQLEQLLLQNALQPAIAPITSTPVATTNDSPVNNSDVDTTTTPDPVSVPEPTLVEPEVTESQPAPTTE